MIRICRLSFHHFGGPEKLCGKTVWKSKIWNSFWEINETILVIFQTSCLYGMSCVHVGEPFVCLCLPRSREESFNSETQTTVVVSSSSGEMHRARSPIAVSFRSCRDTAAHCEPPGLHCGSKVTNVIKDMSKWFQHMPLFSEDYSLSENQHKSQLLLFCVEERVIWYLVKMEKMKSDKGFFFSKGHLLKAEKLLGKGGQKRYRFSKSFFWSILTLLVEKW